MREEDLVYVVQPYDIHINRYLDVLVDRDRDKYRDLFFNLI